MSEKLLINTNNTYHWWLSKCQSTTADLWLLLSCQMPKLLKRECQMVAVHTLHLATLTMCTCLNSSKPQLHQPTGQHHHLMMRPPRKPSDSIPLYLSCSRLWGSTTTLWCGLQENPVTVILYISAAPDYGAAMLF